MCDLALTRVTPVAPSAPGGFGYVELAYTTSSSSRVTASVTGLTQYAIYYPSGGYYEGVTNGLIRVYNLPPGQYASSTALLDNPDCYAEADFTIPDAPIPVDTSLAQAPSWQPVGGVLPNPVPLPIEATLADAAGSPRAGLFAEVELWAPGAAVAFASFRATVRQASQTVDAAPYLRAQLRASLRYASPLAAPQPDPSACLAYSYRFRIGDRTGPGPWQARAGVRYAVLAALPLAADTMQPYVADGAGRVASVFPSGEAVQFAGYPLEVSVLLPPYTVPRWAQYRYLDGAGQEVEVRSLRLADELPAGLLRLPLPADVPLLASSVEVAIVDTARTVTSPGGHLPVAPPASPRGTYEDPLLTLY